MLGADTPSGRAYRRYDIDGYGEWLDGSGWPVRKFGIGRPWPLLAGERGHLDVLAGGDAKAQLQAMLAMRGLGGLLPEQIWDSGPLPWRDLRPGQPTGSAMPLAWAHSELIKLAVAVATKKPVELLNLVSDRYHAAVPASQTWFWRDSAPVLALPAGRTLVVADLGPFTLHYGFDDWDPATITERDARRRRARPVRGHPHPGRPGRAGQPAVRTPLPGRQVGTRHPARRHAERSRASHTAAVSRPRRPARRVGCRRLTTGSRNRCSGVLFGVARSIGAHPVSTSRSARSARPPPCTPNRRLA